MADAEAFVCQLYNHGADGVDINEERAAEFPKVKKNRLDSLPPTKDTLHLHMVSGQLAYVQTRLRQLAYAYW